MAGIKLQTGYLEHRLAYTCSACGRCYCLCGHHCYCHASGVVVVVVALEFSAGYLSLPDKGLTSLPPSPLLYTDRENVLHNCHCCFGFSMAQELTLPGPAQLHTSFLPSQLPLPQCGKSGILKEGESTPSSTAWLFFNSALLTNTAFPNYNSTRKLYSFIKKKKRKRKNPPKFRPHKNSHLIKTNTYTNKANQIKQVCCAQERHSCSWRLCASKTG